MSVKTKIVMTTMGHYHPKNVIENGFFSELDIDSNAEWVSDRTGIESRRSVLSKQEIADLRYQKTDLKKLRAENKVMPIADMAENAWKVALERQSKTSSTPFDMLICGTSVPDFDIPANGCTIASKIDLKCPSIDANSACSSFVADLHLARGLLQSNLQKKIAVFNPERYSIRMNYEDRNSCVLFGDGCAAAVIESGDQEGLEVLDTYIASDPKDYELVKIPDGECFSQNGKAVQKFAISKTLEATRCILERNNLKPTDVDYFTGHQANLRMVSSAAERLGLDDSKHLYNVDEFGNQGSAGAPAVLSMNWDRFKSGDLIVIAVVGSGLTWGSALFRKI